MKANCYFARALNSFRDFKQDEIYCIVNETKDYYDVLNEDYYLKEKVRIYKTRIVFEKIDRVVVSEEDVILYLRGQKYNRVLTNLDKCAVTKIPKVDITLDDFIQFIKLYKDENPYGIKARFNDYRNIYYLCVRNARFLEDCFFEGRDVEFLEDLDIICAYIGGLTSNGFYNTLFTKYSVFAEILRNLEQSKANKNIEMRNKKFSEFEIFFYRILIENYSFDLRLNERNKNAMLELINRDEILSDSFTKFAIAKLYITGSAWLRRNEELAEQYFKECLAEGIFDSFYFLGIIYEMRGKLDEKNFKKAYKQFLLGASCGITPCKMKISEYLYSKNAQNKKNILNAYNMTLEILNDLKTKIEKESFDNCFPETAILLARISKSEFVSEENKEIAKQFLFQAKYVLEKREFYRYKCEQNEELKIEISELLKTYDYLDCNGKKVEICSDFDINGVVNNLKSTQNGLGLNLFRVVDKRFYFQLFNTKGENKLLTAHSTNFVDVTSFVSLNGEFDPRKTKRKNIEILKNTSKIDNLSVEIEQNEDENSKILVFKSNENEISRIYLKSLFLDLTHSLIN